jgi:uncharacterized LabA/DUF88 family protein
MSQPTSTNHATLDANVTPDGASEQKARPRRRRAAARPKDASATQATIPVAPAPPPAAPVAAAGEPAPQPSEAPHHRGNGRGRRGGRGRKPAVQLIVPSDSDGGPSGESAGAPEADIPEVASATGANTPPVPDTVAASNAEEAGAVAAPRIVPVTTGDAAPTAETTPAAREGAAPEPAAAPRRYRFDRRPPTSVPTPLVRPERLSAVPPVASEPGDEGWLATVAQVSPADIARSAVEHEGQPEATQTAPAPHAEGGDEVTVDDLISALGLRGPAALAPNAPAAAEPPSEAEVEVEAATPEVEGQGPTRRRRRRRRGGSHSATTADEAEDEHGSTDTLGGVAAHAGALPAEPEVELEREAGNGYEPYYPYTPLEQPYSPYTRAPRERATPPSAWDVAAGQQQAQPYSREPNPFGSPEPSFARGFGPQPRGVAGPPREPLVRPARTERGMDVPPMSSNQLAQVVSHAISQQTDRLLNELRRQPPGMLLQLPALPSTERVGVFVDVANVLYSARTLHMALDFGRLLGFLRADRRLIRAHAYAPTNPDPNADQAFLAAVKGLGYRITTKNYKTFASGAKKADMDLDLCMDIVRMVDAGAVDTIVLVSGDSDFLPLLEYCSDHGVRVEVAAFDDSAAMILRQSCDLFINLSMVDEIRA